MPTLIVPSGAKVEINEAPFEDADALKTAITKEYSGSNISMDYDPKKTISQQNIDVSSFAKIIALVDSSTIVKAALDKCLTRCTYNGDSITNAVFEPTEARQDYYPIRIACLKENVLPFFASLLSPFLPAIQAVMDKAGTTEDESQK